jgi:hypothetical protein
MKVKFEFEHAKNGANILYYQCVAEKDPTRLQALVNQSNQMGIELNESPIELLKECHYNEHLRSISSLTPDFSWDYDFVNKRTDCLLRIIWNRISSRIYEYLPFR